jgi:hypothetical protein
MDAVTSIDLSGCGQIQDFFVIAGIPQLESLFIKNGYLNIPQLTECPNLNYFCVDESEVGTFQSWYPDAEVNTYCTTSPAGNPNTISGDVTYDFTTSGCVALANPSFLKFKIDDGTSQGINYTSNSSYLFYTDAGDFTITPEMENAALFNISPASASVNFVSATGNQSQNNFCITANGIHPDIELVIVPTIGARPGFDAEYQLLLRNKGNQVVAGTLTFTYDDAVLDFVGSLPVADQQNSGSLTYDYADLSPLETRTIEITLNANGPMETRRSILTTFCLLVHRQR